MKLQTIKLLLLVLCPFFAISQEKYVQKLGDKGSIVFHAKPEQLPFKNAFMWRHATDSAISMAYTLTEEELGVKFSGEDLTQEKMLDEFSIGLTSSFAGSKVISKKITQFLGYTCYDISLEYGNEAPRKKVDIKTIFVDTHLYALYYYELLRPLPKDKARFFTSFKLDRNEASIQNNDPAKRGIPRN